MQTRGFNNFSYADIASELGITTASLHYHFPGKAELGHALITRYAHRFSQALTRSNRANPTRAPNSRPTPAYTPTCSAVNECACAESSPPNTKHCPKPMRTEVIRFFDDNQEWLSHLLTEGQTDHTLNFTGRKTSPRTSSAPSKERCSSPAPTATFTDSTPRQTNYSPPSATPTKPPANADRPHRTTNWVGRS